MVEWGRAPADGNPRRRPERSAGGGGGKEVAILELWIQAEGAVLLWIQENLRFDLLTPLVRFITFPRLWDRTRPGDSRPWWPGSDPMR